MNAVERAAAIVKGKARLGRLIAPLMGLDEPISAQRVWNWCNGTPVPTAACEPIARVTHEALMLARSRGESIEHDPVTCADIRPDIPWGSPFGQPTHRPVA